MNKHRFGIDPDHYNHRGLDWGALTSSATRRRGNGATVAMVRAQPAGRNTEVRSTLILSSQAGRRDYRLSADSMLIRARIGMFFHPNPGCANIPAMLSSVPTCTLSR